MNIADENLVEMKFDEFAFGARRDIDEKDNNEENLRLRKNLRAVRYWEGRQLGIITATGQWKDVEVEQGDPWYPNNQIRFFCRSLLKEMVRSRHQLSVQPRDDRIESRGAARFIRGLLDRYRQDLFGPLASQTEMTFSMLEGNYFRDTYWDATIDTHKHTVTDYEQQKVTIGKDAYHCPQCGSGGYLPSLPGSNESAPPLVQPQQTQMSDNGGTVDPTGTPTGIINEGPVMRDMPCPNCNGPATIIPSLQKEAQIPTGQREVPTGDIRSDIIDPMEMKVHLRARTISQSPFVERNRMILQRLGKMKYPHWKGGTSKAAPDKVGIRMQTELEGSPGNYKSHTPQGTYSRESGSDLVLYTQLWLDPVYYFDIVLSEDYLEIPNKPLYAGDRPIEKFPNGIRIDFLGDSIVDFRDENKNKRLTHGNYIASPHRFWGDSAVDDSLDLQWELNNLDSLMIEHIMFNVGGQTWFNQLKIEGSTIGARPRERNPMRNPSPTDKPGDYIHERQPPRMTPEIPGKAEQIKKDIQSQMGAFAALSGMPDVNVNTATGMAILRDQALGFLGPPLELRGEVDVEWSYQILELIKENMVGERFLPKGRYDDIEAKWFTAADIRTDFIITQVPGSWFPMSDFDMRQRVLELSTFGGMPMGIWNPSWPHQLRSYVLERYNIPMFLDEFEPDERKQRIELETMRDGLKELETQGAMLVDQNNQPDALAVEYVAGLTPPEMFVDIDDIHFEWIQNYLKTDDGMKEHPVIRAALLLHQRAHVDNKFQAEKMLAIMEGIAKGTLIPMPDGSVIPAGMFGGVQPPSTNEGVGTGSAPPTNQTVSTRGGGIGSPNVVGSQGAKKAGDNLPLVKAGATNPGSQPMTG